MLPTALLLLVPAVLPAAAQEPDRGRPAAGEPGAAPAAELVPGELPADAAPEAKALWREMLAAVGAAGASADAPPITQFDVRLGLLTRSGRRGPDPRPETHEFDTRVLYMAPWFVRYRLSEEVETGFGPSGFWLREGDEVRSLQGREYTTDREQVQQVHSLCTNFLSIAAPSQLRLAVLERVPRLPIAEEQLPRRPGIDYRRLEWLRVVTPDFRLVEAIQPKVEGSSGARPDARYRVYFGLDAATKLPRALHVVRVGALPEDMIFEQLILLESWAEQEESEGARVRLPQRLFVHERLPTHPAFRDFLQAPDREVYVRAGSSLYPNLTELDFDPTVPEQRDGR